jgi:hypothetical protein
MAEKKDAAQTKMPYAAFTRQLRYPINDMPPYPQNLLSDQEETDIYAFLQGVPGRTPVKDTSTTTTDGGLPCGRFFLLLC